MTAEKQHIRPWAVAVWLLIWQLGSMAMAWAYPHGSILLASPVQSALRLLELGATGAFWRTIAWSSVRIFGGYLLACALGVVLAALSARFRRLRELMAPAVAAIKAIPVVSFIILVLVFLDARQLPLFIAGLMVFPPIYLNTLTAILHTDPALLEMARVYRVPLSRRLWGIYLPAVLPQFRAAASLALGLCWKSGVAAEVIGLPTGSIGEQLYSAKVYFLTPDLFAWTAVIMTVSVLFEKLFLAVLDRLVRKVGC